MNSLTEWRRLTAKYKPKYFARTEKPHPKPQHVAHSFSSGLPPRDGIVYRFWAFTTKRGYDHFMAVYKAVACSDPGEER